MANWTDVKWDYGNIITLNKITNQTQNVVYVKEEGHDVQFIGGGQLTRCVNTGPSGIEVTFQIDGNNLKTAFSNPYRTNGPLNGADHFNYTWTFDNIEIASLPDGTHELSVSINGSDAPTLRFVKTKAMNYISVVFRPASTHNTIGADMVGGTFGICGFVAYGHYNRIPWGGMSAQ